MRLFNLVLLLALVLLAAFAALKWSALAAPTTLSFGIATLQAPLGLILLGFALVFAFAFFVYAAAQRTAQLVEARRHAQELRAARELAESAEASCTAALAAEMKAEFERLHRAIEDNGNGLAAALGQVDDKLNRMS